MNSCSYNVHMRRYWQVYTHVTRTRTNFKLNVRAVYIILCRYIYLLADTYIAIVVMTTNSWFVPHYNNYLRYISLKFGRAMCTEECHASCAETQISLYGFLMARTILIPTYMFMYVTVKNRHVFSVKYNNYNIFYFLLTSSSSCVM